MAMNGTVLGDAIFDIIIAPDAPAEVKNKLKTMWEQIGGVIVDHITQNAVVNPNIPVSTTGTAVAQTGSTTGPGSIA
jgi:hypothetical protein